MSSSDDSISAKLRLEHAVLTGDEKKAAEIRRELRRLMSTFPLSPPSGKCPGSNAAVDVGGVGPDFVPVTVVSASASDDGQDSGCVAGDATPAKHVSGDIGHQRASRRTPQ